MFFVAREEVTGVTGEHRGSTNTPLVIHTGKPCVEGVKEYTITEIRQ